MTSIRWQLINELRESYPAMKIKHSYGYITKNNRINKVNIDKTHANDAFVIAGGIKQSKVSSIYFEQIKRNNRSLEKFYDSKVIDIRTGEKVSGGTLDCGRRTRNKNHKTENLREYRGIAVKKGQRRIRKQRYFYQPGDLVKYDGRIFTVRGTQNNGKYIALKEIKKVPKLELLTPYRFRKGFA